MRIKLVTLYDEKFEAIGKLSSKIMAAYCAKRGYEFICYNHLPDRSRRANWNKVKIIEQELDGCDWVLWMDADSIPVNNNFAVERLISQCDGKDLIISGDDAGLCSGIFLIRNCSWSLKFLQSLWFLGQMKYGHAKRYHVSPQCEQVSIIAMKENFPFIEERMVVLPDNFVCNPRSDFHPVCFAVHYWSSDNTQESIVSKMYKFVQKGWCPEAHRDEFGKKILIIGGEGFIGFHLKQRAAVMGMKVVSMDVAGNPDVKELEKFKEFERVYHLAGTLGTSETMDDPAGAVRNNIIYTLEVLEKCKASRTPLTYVTLGNNWINPYSITKNAAADFCRMYSANFGMNIQIAVTYNVFGSHQKTAPVRKIVPEFMSRLIRGQSVEIYGDGSQLVDMVYAPDLANGLLSNHKPATTHFGSANARSVYDVAQDCAQALGINGFKIKNVPARNGETSHGAISPYPMKSVSFYPPALKATADWYKENIA